MDTILIRLLMGLMATVDIMEEEIAVDIVAILQGELKQPLNRNNNRGVIQKP